MSCACCAAPLRSSFAKGRNKHYPYYLCYTKGCEAYGKSTARDKLEDQVGAMIKRLQSTKELFDLATAIFRKAWDGRRDKAKEIARTGKRQIDALDKGIDGIIARIREATNATVVRSYENRIGDLEKQKAILAENLGIQAEPQGTIDEKLEPFPTLLANPWKFWVSEQSEDLRILLRLAFDGPLAYCPEPGYRTAQFALPFKVLSGLKGSEKRMVGPEGLEPPTKRL